MAARLTEPQTKALQELKILIQDAINSYQLDSYEGEVPTIWSVPLLGDERSDPIILKFLKAKDFQVPDALAMIKNTLRWRREVGVDALLEEDLGNYYDKVLFTHGFDKEGCPVWYLVLGELSNSRPGKSTSSDEENQHKFFCWLFQFVEKNIKMLDFSKKGGHSIILIIDLDFSVSQGSLDLYKVTNRFLQLLHDHYPEFITKQLWINASWWYRYYCRAYSLVFDRWDMNKLVVYSGSTKTIQTLFKYISPAQVPAKYGGLRRVDNEQDSSRFDTDEAVTETTISPNSKRTIEFIFAEICDVLWELRVLGWEIEYEAEFLPSIKGRYTTIISKPRKLTATDRHIIYDSFRVSEPGKLVLTTRNLSSKKKKLIYRVKVTAPNGSNVGDEASLRGWLVEQTE